MSTFRFVQLVLLSLGVVGCAQAPIAKTYPATTQYKMQAAHHWDLLAIEVANKVTPVLGGRPLFVRRPHAATPFNGGFHDLLITQLVNQGNIITQEQRDSLTLDYDVQVLRHHDRGYIHPFPGFFTSVAAVGTGVYYLSKAHWAAGLGGAALVGDVWGANTTGGTPDTEVIITASITDGFNYVMRDTGIYYINEGDTGHYQPARVIRTKTMRMVSQ
jgi:hypothetical protein